MISFDHYPLGTSNPVLPIELIIQAFSHLEKHELKSVRLVCKTWAHYASERLFDKLYISPRKEDINVFELVTQHPQLRRCVKKLEHDATRFSQEPTIERYILRQLRSTPLDTEDFMNMHEIRNKHSLDPQIDEYLGELISYHYDKENPWLHKKLKPFNFIIEGYRVWQECAAYQQRCIESGDYLRILVHGLRNLDRLESVHVCQEWDIQPSRALQSQQAHYYNSPFGRTWNIFRAQPRCWKHYYSLAAGCFDFRLLTTALADAQRGIRSLSNTSLPPAVFDTVAHGTEDGVDCSADAYSGLGYLTLTFWRDGNASWRGRYVDFSSKLDKLSGLRNLLRSTTGLKTLDLSFPGEPWFAEDVFRLEQVFPVEVHWTNLTSFRLCAVVTSAKDLVQLLTIRMPKLQVLHLKQVDIAHTEGKWESAIECMKRSMHLRIFSLDCPWSIIREIGYKDVEQYVLHGGRHPCLRPDEPDEASQKYLSAPWI